MKIEVIKGYNCPDDNSNILVELEDGTVTGARFEVLTHKLHSQDNFMPLGVSCGCAFNSPVKYWFAGLIEELIK